MVSPRIYRATGIILKRKNIGEADRQISVFTSEFGKVRLMAKGIRKAKSRRAGHLEVFSETSLLIYRGKSFDGISQASIINSFEALQNDLSKVSYAYYLCELVDALTPENQKHRDVFELLKEYLIYISVSNKESQYEEHLLEFSLALLRNLGFLPAERKMPREHILSYIEQLAERPLTTPRLIASLQG